MNRRKVTVNEECTAMGQRKRQTQVVSRVEYGMCAWNLRAMTPRMTIDTAYLHGKGMSCQGVAQGREDES
jgi:hypothetical protein